MANTPNNYSKFTLTSVPDSSTGAFPIPDYIRDNRSIIENAVKSALKDNEFFYVSERRVDPKSGQQQIDLYVHEDRGAVTKASVENQISTFKGSTQAKYVLTSEQISERERKAIAREERARNREESEPQRFNRGSWLKVIGLLTTLANIARRILSSVLAFSTQTVKDMITAHNLGMSYDSVRAYRHVETAHGLNEGTVTEAVAGEQQKYGNITSLDEKSLEYIAIIMGNKVAEMATMGLGASNPEAIVEAIVDRANELANAGINSVGQYVGEAQARRELYSYLLKYSPQIADIFATMQEEQHNINSLFRNQAETFAEWKNILPTSRGNHPSAQYNIPATLGQEWNVVKDIYNQIKEGIALNLAPELVALLRRIANIRIGMSDRESKALDEKNKTLNQQFIDSAKVQLSTLSDTEADKQRALALNYYIKELEEENSKKEKIANLVPTPDEIVVKGQNLMETAIRFRVAGGKEGYSPAMKYVIDTYLDNAKKSKVEDKLRVEAQHQRKAEIMTEQLEELEKSPEYQKELASEMQKYSGRFSSEARSQAKALLIARYMFGNKADFRYDEHGKQRNLSSQVALALRAGYITSSGGITPVYSVNTDKINLTGEDFEEALYLAIYNKYKNILAGHLANELVYQSIERAKEGTPAYDLDVLQRTYGADLSGLYSKLGAGAKGNIISSAEKVGNVITHHIVFDLNNNGTVEASDVPLMSYTTNRISDVSKITTVEIKDGKVNWVSSDGASAYK